MSKVKWMGVGRIPASRSRRLADPINSPFGPRVDPEVRRNGTTGESSAVHTWAKTTDFGSGTRTDFSYSGFFLSAAKSRFMKKSAKFLWCSNFVGPQWRAPHLSLVRLRGSLSSVKR